jgi:hypothetical protein
MKSNVWSLILLGLLTSLCLFLAVGCAADRATLEHRAAVMDGLAEKINSGTPADLTTNALYVAWVVENERRAAVNLADRFGGKAPTYPYAAKQPTTLPWTPEDEVPAGTK